MNEVDTVDVALYKSRDPKSGDEEETVENLFDCLCSLVIPVENKGRVMKAEQRKYAHDLLKIVWKIGPAYYQSI